MASQNTRASCVSPPRRRRGSEAMHGQAAIDRAAADSERLRGVTHVSIVARERLLNQHALRLLERDLFGARARTRGGAQREIDRALLLPLRQQHRALDDVIELADVSRPWMLEQRLHCGVVERREQLPVTRR